MKHIEHVPAKRLAHGRFDAATQKHSSEGDITASYSADHIAEDKPIRKPFWHIWQGEKFLWIATGTSMGPEVCFCAEEPPARAATPDLISTVEGNTAGVAQADNPRENDGLPPVDHLQGFTSKAEIRAYLAGFADRPDVDVVAFDLWSRPTTFGDLRRLISAPQQTMSLFPETE